MFKFVHAADIHLDSPLTGLSRYEGAPVNEIRAASRKALENLVQFTIDNRMDFVILSGDVFDGDWKDYKTGLFFVKQMSYLRQAKIPVFLIAGNHDAKSQITRSLRIPENVNLFSSGSAETIELKELNVAIHGQSFATREETENLASNYPEPKPDHFNIGILHTSLIGYAEHESYAPCTLDSLLNKGYDYWALGHVHNREVLNESPWIGYPGNLQGRHALETGPKGCMYVTVDNGKIVETMFQEHDVVRWIRLELNLDLDDNEDIALTKLKKELDELMFKANGRILAVRIIVMGQCTAHNIFINNKEKWRNEFRAAAIDVSQGDIWIEKILFKTKPIDLGANKGIGPIENLLEYINIKDGDETILSSQWRKSLDKLRNKLPSELTEGPNKLPFDDPQWLHKTLQNGIEYIVNTATNESEIK